jgi:hypothetical protein
MKLAKPRKGDKADMAVIEYVDRPGEIRAARPPSFFKEKSLEEIMKALGINDQQVVMDDTAEETDDFSDQQKEMEPNEENKNNKE